MERARRRQTGQTKHLHVRTIFTHRQWPPHLRLLTRYLHHPLLHHLMVPVQRVALPPAFVLTWVAAVLWLLNSTASFLLRPLSQEASLLPLAERDQLVQILVRRRALLAQTAVRRKYSSEAQLLTYYSAHGVMQLQLHLWLCWCRSWTCTVPSPRSLVTCDTWAIALQYYSQQTLGSAYFVQLHTSFKHIRTDLRGIPHLQTGIRHRTCLLVP